jgi:hypothetical protein
MPSEVQKRCLLRRADAGPGSLRARTRLDVLREPTRTPIKTDLNPHETYGLCGCRGGAWAAFPCRCRSQSTYLPSFVAASA